MGLPKKQNGIASMARVHKILPSSGPAREALREKGQFWTPDWVADAMVAYMIGTDTDHVFDPAVGAGAFLALLNELQFGRVERSSYSALKSIQLRLKNP